MKNIALLGSTGSIGTQTLDVVRANPELFHMTVLAANTSDALLEQQIKEFSPELAVLADPAAAKRMIIVLLIMSLLNQFGNEEGITI